MTWAIRGDRSPGVRAVAVLVLVALVGCGESTLRLESAPLAPSERSEVAAPAVQTDDPAIELGPDGADWAAAIGTDDRAGAVDTVDTDGTTIVAHGATPRIVAYTRPDGSSEVIELFDNPTPRGGTMVFQALGEPVGGWIEVLLPIRPNGSSGWIQVSDVTLQRNRYRMELDVGAYRLTIFKDDEPVLETIVAIGDGDTPTPIGDFFLTELVRPPDPDGRYGPFAYGLSGFSDTLDSFNGGPGIIGIHGTNEPERLGTNVSHGCVRVDNDVISRMAAFLPLGTPISIRN